MPMPQSPDDVEQAAREVLKVDAKLQVVRDLRNAGAERARAHEAANRSDEHYSAQYVRAIKTGWSEAQLKQIGFEPAPQRPRGRPRKTSSTRGRAPAQSPSTSSAAPATPPTTKLDVPGSQGDSEGVSAARPHHPER